MTQNSTDPRPVYYRSVAWAQKLVEGVRPEQLDDPTPCTEFDVRALLGHLTATVRRATAIGAGEPLPSPMTTGVADDAWAATFAGAAAGVEPAWSDDAVLDKDAEVPWGVVPCRIALWGYTGEALVHGWDLAVATGQDCEADPDLAEATIVATRNILPAEMRGEGVPFDGVVESAPGAGPTERLANWTGHRR